MFGVPQEVRKKFFKYMTLVYLLKGARPHPPPPKLLNKEITT